MIKIAICDDDIMLTTMIEEMLYEIGKEQSMFIVK